jgi:hypothetical protein
MQFNYLLLIFIYIFSLNLYANERYVCKNDDESSIKLITNFYIIDKKIVMSGALGNGEYKILNKSVNGFLAVNSSFIGEEFGLETILINKKHKLFIYKTFINRENNNNIVEVKGICSLAN